MFCSILVFWKRNSECYSNRSEKPSNMESPWNVLKIYVSKALGLLNKNLVILSAPQQRNFLLPTSKVCSQIHDSESHKPAFSSTSLNCRSLNHFDKFIHGKLTVEFWTIDSKIAISRNIGLRPIKHNEKLFRISKLTIDILVTFVFRDILIKYFSILKNSLLKIRFKTA